MIIPFIMFLLIVGLLMFTQQEKPGALSPFFPTPTPLTRASLSTQTQPPVPYVTGSGKRLLDKIERRELLSPADASVKRNLIAASLNAEKFLSVTVSYRILYIPTFDIFQVELLSNEIVSAKRRATEWFTGQGLSSEGVCNLPIMFYLNSEVATAMRNTNTVFNPLPEGC